MNGIEQEVARRSLIERLFKKEKPEFGQSWRKKIDELIQTADKSNVAAKYFNVQDFSNGFGHYFSIVASIAPYKIVVIEEKGKEKKPRKAMVHSGDTEPMAFVEVERENIPAFWVAANLTSEAGNEYLKKLSNSTLYTGLGTFRWRAGWPEPRLVVEAAQRHANISYS